MLSVLQQIGLKQQSSAQPEQASVLAQAKVTPAPVATPATGMPASPASVLEQAKVQQVEAKPQTIDVHSLFKTQNVSDIGTSSPVQEVPQAPARPKSVLEQLLPGRSAAVPVQAETASVSVAPKEAAQSISLFGGQLQVNS